MPTPANNRPKYYDVNLLHLPLPGLVSIFHRVTAVVLLLVLVPAVLYLLQATLSSESGFNFWRNVLNFPLVKLLMLGLVWAFFHHFFAGIRYLFLDFHVGISLTAARRSAAMVLIAGALTTLVFGVRIW